MEVSEDTAIWRMSRLLCEVFSTFPVASVSPWGLGVRRVLGPLPRMLGTLSNLCSQEGAVSRNPCFRLSGRHPLPHTPTKRLPSSSSNTDRCQEKKSPLAELAGPTFLIPGGRNRVKEGLPRWLAGAVKPLARGWRSERTAREVASDTKINQLGRVITLLSPFQNYEKRH